jgi:vacuolar-type H+-ATPase subunit E/Vma4
MPLKDLLTAIEKHLQTTLDALQSTHEAELATLKTEAKQVLQNDLADLEQKFELKKLQLSRKTNDHAEREKSNSILMAKRSLLDEVYNQTAASLAPVWQWALKQVHQAGTLLPSKAFAGVASDFINDTNLTVGETIEAAHGFKVQTKTQEFDFTLETILNSLVRPATEHLVAEKLFN